MVAITVTFRCGHAQVTSPIALAALVCVQCGERIVSRVSGATPRFVGACRGPFAETKAVEPAVVSLASTPLVLKTPKE